MLTIRPAQMAALGAYSQAQFEQQAFLDMQGEWPDECAAMGDDALRQLIHDGLKKAAKFRIDFKSDILDFISFMIEWGPDFESSPDFPWALAILTANNPGTLKIQQLELRLDPLRTGEEA